MIDHLGRTARGTGDELPAPTLAFVSRDVLVCSDRPNPRFATIRSRPESQR